MNKEIVQLVSKVLGELEKRNVRLAFEFHKIFLNAIAHNDENTMDDIAVSSIAIIENYESIKKNQLKSYEADIPELICNFKNQQKNKSKVVCINKDCTNLTFGKEYEVLKAWKEKSRMKPYEPFWVYLVIDDTGNKSVEPCCIFKN